MRKMLLLVVAVALGCGSSSGGPGGGGGNQNQNHEPTATADAALGSIIMGQTTQLSSRASDLDGDTLSYSWAQTAPVTPQGTFSAQSSSSTTWTAPTVSAVTPFTFKVTVSDGRGGTAAPSVTVFAKTSSDLSFMADVEPLLVKSCANCHNSSNPATFSLETGKAYRSLVNVRALFPACSSLLRVKPGDPDASELIVSMTATTCLPDRMPQDDSTYYDRVPAELATFRTWIQIGAPNN